MKVLIIGAGAIGRGFVAPIAADAGATLDFAETDDALLQEFSGRGEYRTAIAGSEAYEFTTIAYERAIRPDALSDISSYDTVFISVGPRNYLACATLVSKAQSVIVLENVRNAAERLRDVSGNERVYFGIPDVIVSNTASPALLRRDPLCVVSEQGTLVLEAGASGLDFGSAVVWADPVDMEKHWTCKFFIHNANHAVVAYLGALGGYQFIHEAMADTRIGPIVERAMRVVTEAIIAEGMVDEELAEDYMTRELNRFQNPLMFDPISRVARDPLRKLDGGERLILALKLVVEAGLDPFPIMLGVNAAMEYAGTTDDDLRFLAYRRTHRPDRILRDVCRLEDERLIRGSLETSAREYLGMRSAVLSVGDGEHSRER